MPEFLINFLYRIAAFLARFSARFHRWINGFAIDRIVRRTRSRPHPWSTREDYVSWAGLTDRTYNARHLPAVDIENLPPVAAITALFETPGDRDQHLCPKSTCLFPAFAQYLTDGFIRTHIFNDFHTGETEEDRRRNTSNHEIDMSPLYGRTEAQTRLLRTLSEEAGEKGRLKSETLGSEEYPLRLFNADGDAFNPLFADSDGKLLLDTPLGIDHTTPEMRATLFAVGGDRANAAPQVSMLNTLFLREHNRLAGELEHANPMWNDAQIFETARNIIIVMFIKIVVEEYINHINNTPLKFIADPKTAWDARWNRPNWITAEFGLLYRWHSLIPQTMVWAGGPIDGARLQLNNAPLLNGGLASAFADISGNRAAELGLHNSADFLVPIEGKAVEQARINRIAPFTHYQEAFGHKRAQTFFDITPDVTLQNELRSLYGDVDRLEFYTGLFAEPRSKDGPLPPLLQTMVAVDAFSQALTNPLLSKHIWGDEAVRENTFTALGLDAITRTSSLLDIVERNSTGLGARFVGMTRPGWQPGAA